MGLDLVRFEVIRDVIVIYGLVTVYRSTYH